MFRYYMYAVDLQLLDVMGHKTKRLIKVLAVLSCLFLVINHERRIQKVNIWLHSRAIW